MCINQIKNLGPSVFNKNYKIQYKHLTNYFLQCLFCFRTANNVNGSARRHSPAISTASHGGGGGRPISLMDSSSNHHHHHHQPQTTIVRVVVNKDDRGYGMKVSGDNPVYVQSVKEGKRTWNLHTKAQRAGGFVNDANKIKKVIKTMSFFKQNLFLIIHKFILYLLFGNSRETNRKIFACLNNCHLFESFVALAVSTISKDDSTPFVYLHKACAAVPETSGGNGFLSHPKTKWRVPEKRKKLPSSWICRK